MSEVIKRRPGRPKKNRVEANIEPAPKVARKPAKIESRYEIDEDDDFEGLLPNIPKHIVPDGMRYEWARAKVFGQPDPSNIARREKRGWTPVPAERHPGLFLPKGTIGEIEIDGMMLVERAEELCKRSELKELRKAREQVWAKEQQLKGGDVRGVTLDSQHPTALRQNRISKSYERVDIPED